MPRNCLGLHNLYTIKICKNLDGVKIGTTITKWGNYDENNLNGVITIKIVKLEGKTWNLLKKKIYWLKCIFTGFLETGESHLLAGLMSTKKYFF